MNFRKMQFWKNGAQTGAKVIISKNYGDITDQCLKQIFFIPKINPFERSRFQYQLYDETPNRCVCLIGYVDIDVIL